MLLAFHFPPEIISYLCKTKVRYCHSSALNLSLVPITLEKSSKPLTGLPKFPMIWHFSLPPPPSPRQPEGEVGVTVRAWALETQHLAVEPGSSYSVSRTLSELLGLSVTQISHLCFELIFMFFYEVFVRVK